MRALNWFLGLFLVAFAAIAVFAYPAWIFVDSFHHAPFHRVASRVGLLTLAIGLFFVARHLRIADRISLGFGLRRQQFLREMLLALALGILSMIPLATLMLAWELRTAPEALPLTTIMATILKGLLSGITIAILEETFMRGAMYSAVERASGARLAVISTAMLYAAMHFLSRYRIPPQELSWASGLELVRGSLQTFAHPLPVLDAFVCLVAVGVLLALVRRQTGSIAACIGLHAGWVTVIASIRHLTDVNAAHPAAGLLSSHDGFVGYLTLAWVIVAGVLLYRFYDFDSAREVSPHSAERVTRGA
ncbi:MAG: CPBP family intramembrane glutamic endopeptidase [Steroidobacteraceae bacterium]